MKPARSALGPEVTEPTNRGALVLLIAPLLAPLRRHRRSTLTALLALTVSAHAASAKTLIGDCNGDGCVRVNELVTGVEIALGAVPASACEAMECNNGGLGIYIDCMLVAVGNALTSCPTVPTSQEGNP